MTTRKSIVLRSMRDERGTRHLDASINADGDLVIQGQDLGSGVEAVFGFREYEWAWTIRARDVGKLREALGAGTDVLSALGEQFSGDQAAGLQGFLDSQGIAYKVWSRVGD